VSGVITASEPSWTAPFTGLSPRQFGKLITALRREGADPVRKGRPWSLREGRPTELVGCDRVIKVIAHWPGMAAEGRPGQRRTAAAGSRDPGSR